MFSIVNGLISSILLFDKFIDSKLTNDLNETKFKLEIPVLDKSNVFKEDKIS